MELSSVKWGAFRGELEKRAVSARWITEHTVRGIGQRYPGAYNKKELLGWRYPLDRIEDGVKAINRGMHWGEDRGRREAINRFVRTEKNKAKMYQASNIRAAERKIIGENELRAIDETERVIRSRKVKAGHGLGALILAGLGTAVYRKKKKSAQVHKKLSMLEEDKNVPPSPQSRNIPRRPKNAAWKYDPKPVWGF